MPSKSAAEQQCCGTVGSGHHSSTLIIFTVQLLCRIHANQQTRCTVTAATPQHLMCVLPCVADRVVPGCGAGSWSVSHCCRGPSLPADLANAGLGVMPDRSTANEVLQLWKVTLAEGRLASLMKHTYRSDKTHHHAPATTTSSTKPDNRQHHLSTCFIAHSPDVVCVSSWLALHHA